MRRGACESVRPNKLTLALDVVSLEVASVRAAISPLEHAFTLLEAVLVDALEIRAVGPALDSFTVLSIVLPEAAVQTAVRLHVEAEAVGLIIEPLAKVHAILADQAAEVRSLVIAPVALVDVPIGPDIDTAAFPNVCAFTPLADVVLIILQTLFGANLSRTEIHQELIGFAVGVDQGSVLLQNNDYVLCGYFLVRDAILRESFKVVLNCVPPQH